MDIVRRREINVIIVVNLVICSKIVLYPGFLLDLIKSQSPLLRLLLLRTTSGTDSGRNSATPQLRIRSTTLEKHMRDSGYTSKQALLPSDAF